MGNYLVNRHASKAVDRIWRMREIFSTGDSALTSAVRQETRTHEYGQMPEKKADLLSDNRKSA